MKRMIAFFLTVAMLCFAGCTAQKAAETIPLETTRAAVPETEQTWQTQPSTEPPTEPSTEPQTQPTEPEPVLHSGLRSDGSFTEGTLFLGDSLTYTFTGGYMAFNGRLGDAKFAAICGSPVTVFFSDTVLDHNSEQVAGYSPEFEGMTFHEAAASMGEKVQAVYMMWGSNYTPAASEEKYMEIVEFLLENCPNATIHLQTIPYGNVRYGEVNGWVRNVYDHYQQAGQPRVMLIDTYTAIGQCTIDGVHLGNTGNDRWYNAIVAHGEELGLSE